MNASNYRFTLDLHSIQSKVSIRAIVGDTSRKLYISLSDGGEPYFIDDKCTAKLSIKRPTKTYSEDLCAVENNSVIVYEFKQHTAIVTGIHECNLTLYGPDGEVLGTPRFTMDVSRKVVGDDDVELTDADKSLLDEIAGAEAARQAAEKERQESFDKIREDIENIQNTAIPPIEGDVEGKLLKVKNGKYALEHLGYSLDFAMNTSTYVMTLYLRNEKGNVVSETAIDLPLESMVVGGYEEDGKIFLELKNGDTVSFELGDFVTGITPHIGANGNWWTGNVDTGVEAAGRSIDRIQYMASGTDSAGRVEHYYDVFAGGNNVIGGFTVTDGLDGVDGISPRIVNGYWWIGAANTNVKAEGKDGKGIKSIARTSGTGAPGTTDTYTITYTDNTTGTYTVYNGKDGADGKSAYTYAKEGGYTGTEAEFYAKMAQEIPTKVSAFDNDSEYIKASEAPVQSVNGKTGAVSLSAADVGARPSTWTPTYSDVGAEKSGAASSVMNAHNTNGGAHNDIRLLIEGLSTRLNSLANSTDEDLDQMAEVVAYIKANKTLIDSITTSKVSVADIVNNLTTNATNKPLSAAQGAALKALIDAITVPTKVSQLDNDAKYLTSYTESDPTVPAWAKAASKPSYSKSEVGLGNVDNVKQYSASNPPPYPVKSVNGKTGEVTIAVPTKMSELQNDSKYVTDAKAETWTFKLKDGSTVTKKVVLG